MFKLITILLSSSLLFGCATPVVPKTTQDYAHTSAMITLDTMRSGGSGVIVWSLPNSSYVLTNKHVCGLIQVGGVVTTDQGAYPVDAYQVYTHHDLCLIRVLTNLHVNTKIAANPPKPYTELTIAGHPALLPTLISKGHFMNKMTIQLMVDQKPCDGTETDPQDMFFCIFTGSKPIVQSFLAQPTSALIMPGSSGSGVFNENGEIAGLVFAGPGEGIGYGFLVPYEYVRDFLSHLKDYPVQYPNKDSKPKNLFTNTLLDFENLCSKDKTKCPGISYSGVVRERRLE